MVGPQEPKAPGAADEHLGALAFLFYRSDDQAKALRYLELAGARAEAAGDPAAAERLWRRALKVAESRDPDAAARVRAELDRLQGS